MKKYCPECNSKVDENNFCLECFEKVTPVKAGEGKEFRKKINKYKDNLIKLLLEKNKIVTRIASIYEKNCSKEMTDKESKEHSKLFSRNSEILIELTKLGYAKEIK